MINSKIYSKNFIKGNYLNKKFNKIFNRIIKNIDDQKNIFHIFSKNFKLNFENKELVKFQRFQTVVVIGMGGSILGAKSIYQFLEDKIKKKFYFLDNLNELNSQNQRKRFRLNKTLFIVISKSGNTLETISNALFFNIFKKNAKNIIIISEKKNNFLFSISRKLNLHYIEHKSYISGRYSVLSEVGLVPAFLMGLDINKLRSSLKKKFIVKVKNQLKINTSILANLIKNKKFSNLVLLNYAPNFEKFLFWYQQLIAESLGKQKMGLMPLISKAPKDHHSLLQLYLDGPKNNLFYIFSFDEKSKTKINAKRLDKKLNYLNNKSMYKIKDSQKKALILTFKKRNIPFKEIIVKKRKENSLSELFAYFILETAIIGKMININPFDQPAVEQVKTFTKLILKKK